ncbi:MAG: endopeptidase La [Terriglobia bacterium]
MARTAQAGSQELGVLPVRDIVLFPQAVLPLTVGRESSRQLIESLSEEGKLIAVVTQRDPRTEQPGPNDLHAIGTAGLVHRVVPMANQSYLVFVEGSFRVRLAEFTQHKPYLRAQVEPQGDILPERRDTEFEALERSTLQLFQEVVAASPNLSDDLQGVAEGVKDPGRLADLIAANLASLDTTARQELLETFDVRERLRRLSAALAKEKQILDIRQRIQSQVEDQLGQSQREFFLREQLKAIQRELGESDETQREVEELRRKVEQAGMPDEVKKEALRELNRLGKMPPAAAEYSVVRTYLDWLVSLPWVKASAQAVDVGKAEQILDEDHYDLEKVKQRILDYLAVRQLKKDMKGPILCFVGPPGVGKTSLGKSIARALGRKFVRISLGGMHDEAEVRGHRRTYIGALPGQIMQALRRAETNDPVFMLDEVDKIGRDFRGDPAAALLEVLDPEQNATFRDHYLDVPFDLSKVLFITTANVLDPVPPALRDRMEVIELPGYTAEEKVFIAQKFLVPKQIQEHGLELDNRIRFSEEALHAIVRRYTYEAGVRNLEREIATLCRKQARRIAQGEAHDLEVTLAVVEEWLGVPKFRVETELEERTRRPGVAVAVAWTPAGGDILFVEAARMPRDKGEFTITGQVGEVMQESMKAALSWVRANSQEVGIEKGSLEKWDIHIHVPAGAIPKDGPSAGVTMVTALVSLFTERPVRPYLAMTGEITLSGLVLPVGGIKEKVLAAKRSSIREVILPKENEPNVRQDIPEHLRQGVTFHFVKTIGELIDYALQPAPARPRLAPGSARPPAPPPAH